MSTIEVSETGETADNYVSLAEKVSLVTRGSDEIGAAIVKALVENGSTVFFCSGSRSLEQALDLCAQYPKKTFCLPIDLSHLGSARNMVHTVLQNVGKVDVLVNNAGIYPQKPFLEIAEEDLREIMVANYHAPFICSQMVARNMIERNVTGSIINVGPESTLFGLTEMIVQELAANRIKVHAISPSTEKIPFGGRGLPEEVARAVLIFATNPALSSGQHIFVNGGLV